MFSLGCMLWECITGERPWRGCNLVQVAFQVRACMHAHAASQCSGELHACDFQQHSGMHCVSILAGCTTRRDAAGAHKPRPLVAHSLAAAAAAAQRRWP